MSTSTNITGVGSERVEGHVDGPTTLRDYFHEIIIEKFNGQDPVRDDYDIFMLTTFGAFDPDDHATEEDLVTAAHRWIDGKLEEGILQAMSPGAVSLEGLDRAQAKDVIYQSTKQILDGPATEAVGRKPRKGDPKVFIRQIPTEEGLSIRLWQDRKQHYEFCLDFVNVDGVPVRKPHYWQLWTVPHPNTPSWLTAGTQQLFSVEQHMGIPDEKIKGREEKWLLKEGMTCVLKHAEKGDITTFMVPMRRPEPVQLPGNVGIPEYYD